MAEVQTNTESGETAQRFIEFVMMQAQNAALFLGQIPHPQKGAPEINLDLARLFIDQLVMIRQKTRGNLSNDELSVLNNAITNLQMAFVEVSEQQKQGGGAPQAPESVPEVEAPAGQSDASIGAYPQLDTPWTFASLGNKVFPSVRESHTICQTPVERSAAESSQATELTGSYLGEHVRVVVILSLYTPTTPDLYYGEIRDIYAPYSQWTTAEETTLMLVMARAIESPEDAYS